MITIFLIRFLAWNRVYANVTFIPAITFTFPLGYDIVVTHSTLIALFVNNVTLFIYDVNPYLFEIISTHWTVENLSMYVYSNSISQTTTVMPCNVKF